MTEEKNEVNADSDIMEQPKKLNKQREDPSMHIEGDTNVEDMYSEEEELEAEEVVEEEFISEWKLVMSQGPTSRFCHEPKEEDAFHFLP